MPTTYHEIQIGGSFYELTVEWYVDNAGSPASPGYMAGHICDDDGEPPSITIEAIFNGEDEITDFCHKYHDWNKKNNREIAITREPFKGWQDPIRTYMFSNHVKLKYPYVYPDGHIRIPSVLKYAEYSPTIAESIEADILWSHSDKVYDSILEDYRDDYG